MDQEVIQKLPGVLIPWYHANKRQLPWRADREPYHVWLSEIMLQQTRVEAVKEYYVRFLTTVPDIASLAACEDDKLHKLWEGLGYYSRVRNLKKAAQVIMQENAGQFPCEYAKVLALPGIGEYTAGAICSICFDEPVAAVDGNVLRVISRLTDDATPIDDQQHKKKVKAILEAVYPSEAGDFTQALMELGATVCGPNKAPDCKQCPCAAFCLAAARGTAACLPVKNPKRGKKLEEKTVFILRCDGRFALCKRENKGLLAGLWQFPDAPGKLEIRAALQYLEQLGVKVTDIYRLVEREHIFTHIKWDMRGYYVEVADPIEGYSWLTAEQIEGNAALPTAYRKFWDIQDK